MVDCIILIGNGLVLRGIRFTHVVTHTNQIKMVNTYWAILIQTEIIIMAMKLNVIFI